MADEEVLAVAPPSDHHLKRKLDDADVSPPDSSDVKNVGDGADKDANNGGDLESSKRLRFDEPEANENGHKQEEKEQGNRSVESEVAVESVETTADEQVGAEEAKEEKATAEGLNDAEPVVEGEQKADDQDADFEGKEAEIPSSEIAAPEGVENTATEGGEQGDGTEEQYSETDARGNSRKIEIPNNKVGVLIGKSGDTIKYLQLNSGAKIQITRDADADPRSATRPVELIGTLESLNKAERLIKDVIAEAEAGGSPSLVARGFTAAISAGSLEIEIPVPGDKVGLIIGRGGETIRHLQTRSGARIQLIPQNVPGEQPPKEKKVKVTGDKKQVEVASELIKEVMNQQPGRQSQFSSSGYSQQGYRPRGPSGGPQWGSRGPHHSQTMPYDYPQRGPYPSQNQQYPPQPYSNYPPQGPPRSGYGSWDHRPPAQGPPSHGGGYDYYGQGGGHAGNAPGSNPHSGHMPGHHASGPSMAPPHSQANYNYPQPRGQEYGHQTPYPQSAPPAQSYGHGYGDTQASMQQQQPYSGQGYAPQQQGYAPQQQGYAPQQQGYAPQQYNRPPSYGMPSQGGPPQGYAPPAASQPSAEASYQAPVSAPQPYGQNMPPQQQYPQAPYGSAPITNDGYAQPQQPANAGYPQQPGQPVPAYGQPGQPVPSYGQPGQPAPAYGQPGYAPTAGSTSGYGQYPTAQPTYNDQSAAATNTASYGYAGQVDPSAYSASAGQAYGAGPAAAPQVYAQQPPTQPPTQPVYDQTAAAAQSGAYANAPAATPAPAPAGAPVAYGNTLSPQPQPGYPQYDASQQVYTAPR